MRVDEDARLVELTRTNLRALLAKLDGHPPGSLCSLMKQGWVVRAVEDDDHYTDQDRGVMHPATEEAIGEPACP